MRLIDLVFPFLLGVVSCCMLGVIFCALVWWGP